MSVSVADAVTDALPLPVRSGTQEGTVLDLHELQAELEAVAEEALAARALGVGLAEAVRDSVFPNLRAFHLGLRDALLAEIPKDLQPWVENLAYADEPAHALATLSQRLVGLAREQDSERPGNAELQRALAELLVFESVRLRLLVEVWHSEDFERLGGEESDIDDIAWAEVEALLADAAIEQPGVRPLRLMFAAASVSLARDAAERIESLRLSGSDVLEELRMRARLRQALRELRLPESVLLENALANLLGGERLELVDLQAERAMALDGLSRQAMDQRVSRGRRALTRPNHQWPTRRRPALFDLLRSRD